MTRPSRNIPIAILAQFIIGFFSSLIYLVSIFYGISDLESVLNSTFQYPLTAIYLQTTGSTGAALGLLIIMIIIMFIACLGCYITASRVFWTLARDHATPFSGFFGFVSPRSHIPVHAIAFCSAITTVLGCIYMGSSTAFNAFVGSFVVLSTSSYLAAILPHLLTKRKNMPQGYFWMNGAIGYSVNSISCLYMAVFIVIFCFPFSQPVAASNMNYASLITGGLSLFIGAFWLWRQSEYEGPRTVPREYISAKDAI